MAVLRDSSNVALTITAAPANSAAITLYSTDGLSVASQSKATYSASDTFTPPATPTDMVRITGSDTKTIRVLSVYFASSSTAGGVSEIVFVIKRANFNLSGTFVAATAVPLDSLDAAATATVGHYTANPATLGQAYGTINTVRLALPPVVPTSFAGHAEDAGVELIPWAGSSYLSQARGIGADIDKPCTLRGANESLVVNFNSAALIAGQVHAYRITWTEE